jgi:uncharacterized protein YecA (UPF0149 family)
LTDGTFTTHCTALAYPGLGRLVRMRVEKAGRNDPCPCKGGKKYKKCHGNPHLRAAG